MTTNREASKEEDEKSKVLVVNDYANTTASGTLSTLVNSIKLQ